MKVGNSGVNNFPWHAQSPLCQPWAQLSCAALSTISVSIFLETHGLLSRVYFNTLYFIHCRFIECFILFIFRRAMSCILDSYQGSVKSRKKCHESINHSDQHLVLVLELQRYYSEIDEIGNTYAVLEALG